MALIEFQTIRIDSDKEAEDKERCKNLKQDYDPSEMEESDIYRYIANLSYPIVSIQELTTEYKGKEINAVQVVTTHERTPFLLINYEDFIGLMKQVDKNFNILAPSKIYDQDGNIISSSQ
jgi:hypothetical protein